MLHVCLFAIISQFREFIYLAIGHHLHWWDVPFPPMSCSEASNRLLMIQSCLRHDAHIHTHSNSHTCKHAHVSVLYTSFVRTFAAMFNLCEYGRAGQHRYLLYVAGWIMLLFFNISLVLVFLFVEAVPVCVCYMTCSALSCLSIPFLCHVYLAVC